MFILAPDYLVRAAIGGYEASALVGGVLSGDQRVVIMNADLVAAGVSQPVSIISADKIYVGSRQYAIQTAAAFYAGSTVRAWEIQARG
jgi:hypothetical protein